MTKFGGNFETFPEQTNLTHAIQRKLFFFNHPAPCGWGICDVEILYLHFCKGRGCGVIVKFEYSESLWHYDQIGNSWRQIDKSESVF